MGLVERLNEELKAAMRAKDQSRLAALRALRGAVLEEAKSGKGTDVPDARVVQLAKKQIKQRVEAAENFRQHNREDLANVEQAQIEVLEDFLPPALTHEELAALVDQAIADTGARTPKDMGKVMKAVQQAVQQSGKDADNKIISDLVKERLQS